MLAPATLMPNGLGHTFASLLCAVGEDPRHVMGRLGHADAKFTCARTRKAMGRRDGEPGRLRAVVKGERLAERAMELPRVPDPEGR